MNVRIVGFYLLLGAVTTVAVAWYCAATILPWWGADSPGIPVAYVTGTTIDAENPGWVFWYFNQPGATRVFSQATYQCQDDEGGELPLPRPGLAPFWSRVRGSAPPINAEYAASERDGGCPMYAAEDARGWPFRALMWQLELDYDASSGYWYIKAAQWGIPLERSEGIFEPPELSSGYLRLRPYSWYGYALPLKPLLLGFVTDSVFYGSGWYLLTGFPIAVFTRWRRHRRRKAGRCSRCGYDLRGCVDEGCPECGWRRGS